MTTVAERVRCAITHLCGNGRRVSLDTISRAAEEIDGRSLARSSILRNPVAAEAYRAARTCRPGPRKRLKGVFAGLGPEALGRALTLQKRSKPELIRHILDLEGELRHLRGEAQALRRLAAGGHETEAPPPAQPDEAIAKYYQLLALTQTYRARRYPPPPKMAPRLEGGTDAP